jgi:hypothetical protein
MRKYPVHEKDLKQGTKQEMREHPSMSETTARRTARQHLERHPMTYQMAPVFDKMLDAREKKIAPVRKKKPPVPLATRMMTWTPNIRY